MYGNRCGLHQVAAGGVHRCLHSVAGAGLDEDIADMTGDGIDADEQFPGDLRVVHSHSQ